MPIKISPIRVSARGLLGLLEYEKPRIVWVPETKVWRALKPSDPNLYVEDMVLRNLVYFVYNGATMGSN